MISFLRKTTHVEVDGRMVAQGEQIRQLVSVIIPTHNRARFLREMLGSVAAQTYRPIEVLVVDDGSTDDTPQMMEEIAQELGEVEVACHYTMQPKSNGSHARNTGLQLSSGQYVVFMDSDDYAHPEMISRMVGALERTGADYCVCDSERFRHHPGDTGEAKTLSRRRHSARAHLRAIALQTWFLAKRSVIAAIGPWDEELTHRQDVEYTFRVLVHGFRGHWIPEVLYYWRKHDDQISGRNDEEAAESSLLALRKMVGYAKLHGRHTRAMRVAFGWEFARLAHACHQLGYGALAQRAEQLANSECWGVCTPFRVYRLARQVLGQDGVDAIKSFFQRVFRRS